MPYFIIFPAVRLRAIIVGFPWRGAIGRLAITMSGVMIILALAGGYPAWSDVPRLSKEVPSEQTQPKQAQPKQITLEVVNDSDKTFTFTLADLAKLPQKEIEATDHKGDKAKYSGVLLANVLRQADVSLGASLKGKLLVNYLVVEAADKYRVVFSLPEIDPEWTDKPVLLASTRNGEPLDVTHGPFQIVVPAEKRHSRWVKQVARLTVRSDSK
jgi:DMSO/TMAO reductase YedYZ molybdopterin-dependent catalytic subunit